MPTCRRSRIFIDREVQTALMLRVASYWMFSLLSITLMLLCWNVMTGPHRRFVEIMLDIFHRHAPALAASTILLPLVMIDVARMSTRFVGPIIRLRGALGDLAENGRTRPISFRDDDFWQDLAGDFNRVAERVEAGTQAAENRPPEPLVFDDVMLH